MDTYYPNGSGIFKDDNARIRLRSPSPLDNFLESFYNVYSGVDAHDVSFHHMQSLHLNPIKNMLDEMERKLQGLSTLPSTLEDLKRTAWK